jgi:GxxExxY protein
LHPAAGKGFSFFYCDWQVGVVLINSISREIVDSAMAVHSALGPGLLESAYKTCLAYELRSRGLSVDVEVAVPVVYRGAALDVGYRLDLMVEHAVIVEAKAVIKLLAVHQAQLLSHLRLTDKRVGLLINFHVPYLKQGIVRLVNRFQP